MPEQTTADGEADSDGFPTRPWASATPGIRLRGSIEDIIYSGDVTATQNDSSYGVVVSSPSLVTGDLYRNQIKPEDGTTADGVGEDQSRPTDYRIADTDDRAVTVANGCLISEEENAPNVYDPADGFEEDEVLIWFNGMSGERISRVLDFNGRPFVRFNDEGDLVPGLYQATEAWRNEPERRSELADKDLAPRTARYPVLREGTDDVLIDLSRYRGGRGYEVHVFDAEEFEDEFGSLEHDIDEIDRDDYHGLETDSEFEMQWSPVDEAHDRLATLIEEEDIDVDSVEDLFYLERGDPWIAEESTGTGSGLDTADVSVDAGDEETIEEQHDQFADMIVDELPDGMTPDEAYDGGLEGLIGRNADSFHVTPDADDVRERVYANVAWLDVEDLE